MQVKKFDFESSPYIVLWELTRACALACQHCRAKANRRRNPSELSEKDITVVFDQLEDFGRPLLVFTGGDPFERPDLLELVSEAKHRKFKVALTPSATALVSQESVRRLASAGLERLAISLDGADAEIHDSFRRVKGSFDHTLRIVNWARDEGLPIQINTSICKFNYSSFEKIHSLVKKLGAVLWSVFFIVPTGRANREMQISAAEAEDILKKMSMMAMADDFDIKATAAPHFRRVLLENVFSNKPGEDSSSELSSISPHMRLGALRSYQSVNDGKGIMFISHTGDVYPSGFLPISAGNLKEEKLVHLYRSSELFKNLRNPELITGKCGICKYKNICGGSRARAFAETGDYLAEDSLCSYDQSLV